VSSEPEVSVIIPTYNRSSLLRDAVASVLGQDTRIPFEIIVVDNNSKDDTAAVVRSLMDQHQGRIKYIVETEQGNAHARNRGVQTARAPIIAFLDDDVTVETNWLTSLKHALDSHADLAFVGGKVLPQWTVTPPSWLTPEHWSPLAVLDYGPGDLLIGGNSPRGLLTANIAIRKNVFDEIGSFSPHLQRVKGAIGSMEDTEFLLRVCRSGKQGMYLPSMVAHAPVDEERLSKAYHRRWHTGHGHFYAVMQDPEWERSNFRVAGVPGHLYKHTARHALYWLIKTLARHRDAAFTDECQLRFFRGFYRQRRRQLL
jgi:glucosyl-dolichyl phosphate glucuronosyltransferase